MAIRFRGSLVLLAACVMLLFAGFAAAQGAYTVVTVLPDGAVVLRGPNGVHQYDVAPGTTFNADGKAGTTVAELKPGMKVTGLESGIANWKTTNVMVTEELNAEVVAKAGNTMLIRGAKGTTRKYEWSDAKDISIVKDGKLIDMSAINVGDRITGMVVQKAVAGMAKAAPAADTSAADAAAKKAAAEKAAADASAKKVAADKAAADAAATTKKLPKTASEVPLAGLAGVLSLAAGVGLTAFRKSRSK